MANPANLTLLALLPLIAWRMYARIRRNIGRQRLGRIRPWVTLVLFPLILLVFADFAYPHFERLWWLAGGLAIGAALSVYGLKKTQFETIRGEGIFYTPHAPLGIALSVLLVARVGWRLYEVFTVGVDTSQQHDIDFVRSPVTLVVFGLLAGYYIGYNIGLVRYRFGVMRAKRLREAAEQQTPG